MSTPRSVRLVRTAGLMMRSLSGLAAGYGWRRGAVLFAAKLRKSPRVVVVVVPGAPPLALRSGRGQTDAATLLHVWHERCYELELDREPTWIVDAGANAGYATTWFADRYPSATVIAIEPDPDNLNLLRRNTNTLPNVRIVAAALAAEPGVMDLVDTGGGPWAMRVGAAGAGAGRVVGQVECITMAQIFKLFDIDRLDYLKVDIEGSELEVLQDAETWIAQVDAAAIELHDRYRPGCSRAWFAATASFSREFNRGENWFAQR